MMIRFWHRNVFLHVAQPKWHNKKPEECIASERIKRYVKWGASPRGCQALIRSGRVRALAEGRPDLSDLPFYPIGQIGLGNAISFQMSARFVDRECLFGFSVPSFTGDLRPFCFYPNFIHYPATFSPSYMTCPAVCLAGFPAALGNRPDKSPQCKPRR
jgi:hypothetical protein